MRMDFRKFPVWRLIWLWSGICLESAWKINIFSQLSGGVPFELLFLLCPPSIVVIHRMPYDRMNVEHQQYFDFKRMSERQENCADPRNACPRPTTHKSTILIALFNQKELRFIFCIINSKSSNSKLSWSQLTQRLDIKCSLNWTHSITTIPPPPRRLYFERVKVRPNSFNSLLMQFNRVSCIGFI